MTAPQRPRPGDVIVRASGQAAPGFVLHIGSGPDQIFVRDREEAVSQAVAFANRENVQAWFQNGDEYAPLASARAAVRTGRPST
jgi:hypothetical protein